MYVHLEINNVNVKKEQESIKITRWIYKNRIVRMKIATEVSKVKVKKLLKKCWIIKGRA